MKIIASKLREVTAVYTKERVTDKIIISCSADVAKLASEIFPMDIEIREAMLVLLLNNSNQTISFSIASIGGITATLVDIRLILRDALLTQSTGIILIHNHPSGSLTPSEADKTITDKIKKAANLMDIKLLDHLILTENGYYSFEYHARL